MYTAGMFLNDLADETFDRQHRRDRPIPNGDVRPDEVMVVGFGLLVVGAGVVASTRPGIVTIAWLVALGTAILYYDYHHKQIRPDPCSSGTTIVSDGDLRAAVGTLDRFRQQPRLSTRAD